jgi:hypothetical protein
MAAVVSGAAVPGAGPVPLDDRVHHAEEQPRRDRRVHVRPHVAIGFGLLDQAGHDAVELPPPLQGVPLDLGVAPHAQQQRDVRQPVGQHLDAALHQPFEPLDGGPAGLPGLGGRLGQPVERPVEGQAEQVLLAVHVVVDGRLRDAEPPGQDLHAGAVVTTLVEDGHGHGEQRFQVIAGPAGATGGTGGVRRAGHPGRTVVPQAFIRYENHS